MNTMTGSFEDDCIQQSNQSKALTDRIHTYIPLYNIYLHITTHEGVMGSLQWVCCMLTCALRGVNTFRKRQSSETFVGHTIFGSPHGTGCGQPGGSALVWRMPGHGLGGL